LERHDLGCHPVDKHDAQPSGTPHISFYCEDVSQTVKELKAKGVDFTADITDAGDGLTTRFRVPGGFDIELYQPKYSK
jgi:4-hydroxyphenylpyruvate dioxygenase-like putative hemolysin